MNARRLREALIKAIKAVQADAGNKPKDIGDETVPATDLDGFDSLAWVDVAVRLSAEIEVTIESVPFKSPKTGKPASIREVVTALHAKHFKQDKAP